MYRSGADLGEFDWYRWEDLRFPAQAINPVGMPGPASSTPEGLLNFDGFVDNAIAGFAQMPHGWREGSIVKPHMHLLVATSNPGTNSRWKFEYNRGNVNGAFDAVLGSYSTLATITIANPADVDLHVVADFGDISMAGFKASAGIMWKISRLANSDAADNDDSAWSLLEFDIHYQVQKTGTVAEYPS